MTGYYPSRKRFNSSVADRQQCRILTCGRPETFAFGSQCSEILKSEVFNKSRGGIYLFHALWSRSINNGVWSLSPALTQALSLIHLWPHSKRPCFLRLPLFFVLFSTPFLKQEDAWATYLREVYYGALRPLFFKAYTFKDWTKQLHRHFDAI